MSDQLPLKPDTMLGKIHANIAADIAKNLETRATICERYGVTSEQLDALCRHPLMLALIREAEANFNGAENIGERIKIKAQMALEELIPEIMKLASNGAGATRIDAAKLLHDLTGLKKQEAVQGATPERFTLVLNIGDKPLTIDANPLPVTMVNPE